MPERGGPQPGEGRVESGPAPRDNGDGALAPVGAPPSAILVVAP